MSGKVQKQLRKETAAAADALEPQWQEDGKRARYITVRLMPLLPFVAMICMSSQGTIILPDDFRNIWYVGGAGCLMYLSFWWLDIMLLKRNGWDTTGWKWLGLFPPLGFVYLWIRAKYTDKDYGFAIA